MSQRIALGFVVAMVLIASGFALSFYSYYRYDEDGKRVQHTQQVIRQLEDVLSSLKDVETGVRGYVASGDRLFLEPYQAARPGILPQVRRLRQAIDNPAQQQRADTLERLVRDKLAIDDRQVRAVGQVTPALRNTYLRVGKFRMDRVRVLTAQMISTERTLMDKRHQQVARSFRNTLLITLALSLLTIFLLSILYRLL